VYPAFVDPVRKTAVYWPTVIISSERSPGFFALVAGRWYWRVNTSPDLLFRGTAHHHPPLLIGACTDSSQVGKTGRSRLDRSYYEASYVLSCTHGVVGRGDLGEVFTRQPLVLEYRYRSLSCSSSNSRLLRIHDSRLRGVAELAAAHKHRCARLKNGKRRVYTWRIARQSGQRVHVAVMLGADWTAASQVRQIACVPHARPSARRRARAGSGRGPHVIENFEADGAVSVVRPRWVSRGDFPSATVLSSVWRIRVWHRCRLNSTILKRRDLIVLPQSH